jgi:hypothetical protein
MTLVFMQPTVQLSSCRVCPAIAAPGAPNMQMVKIAVRKYRNACSSFRF